MYDNTSEIIKLVILKAFCIFLKHFEDNLVANGIILCIDLQSTLEKMYANHGNTEYESPSIKQNRN